MRILVTGATSGLGLATVKRLSDQGHEIIMASRNMDKLRQLQAQLSHKYGNTIDIMYLDLSSFDSIMTFSKGFLAKYKSLDVLVNNAGVFSDSRAYTEEGYELTLGVNLIGTFLLTKKLLPCIKEGSNGRIVNVGSKAGLHGKLYLKEDVFKKHPHGFRAYSASKLGLLWMTHYLADTNKDFDICVNCIHPGSVQTSIWQGKSLLMKLVGPIMKKKSSKAEDACSIIVDVISGYKYDGKTGLFIEESGIIDDQMHLDGMQELMVYLEELVRGYL